MIIQKLKTLDIVVKERLRGVDSGKVERLKESIQRIGLIHPITVSGGVLVAGLHRLTAHRELGIEEIDCHIIDDDELLQKEIEIDENLHRKELTVLERGKMEAIKKKNEEEWRKRQLTLEYFQTPEEVKYELAKLENIAPEAKQNLKGSAYENDKTFLIDLSELSKENQVSITKDLTVKNIEKIVKAKELKEKYPDKDKNQIKFQLTDEDLEKAQKLVKMYNWRSVPDLARKMVETYLNAFFKDDKDPTDDDILEMFDDLTGNIEKGEYQNTKKGYQI